MGHATGSDVDTELYREPVSPIGRMFLQREFDISIDCFITFQNPVDVAAVKTALASTLLKKCPRFRSIVVTEDNGRQRWKELPEIDINNHLIIVPEEEEEDRDKDCEEEKKNTLYISHYLASLPSSPPLRRDIPMWEVHVLPQRRRSLVLRLHHSLGDCVSLLALLLSSCDSDAEHLPKAGEGEKGVAGASIGARLIQGAAGLWRTMKAATYTLPSVMEQTVLARPKHDYLTLARREGGLEGLQTKLALAELSLEDMKAVKNKLNATINDVFVGVVSYGLAKYFELKSLNEDAAISGVVAVNLRGEGSKDLLRQIRNGKDIKWGNGVGYYMLKILLRKKSNDPLNYVREAKKVLDRKKISLEAQLGNQISGLITYFFGIETATSLDYQMHLNTSLLLSNIVGPSEPITFAENLITKIGVTLSTLPVAMDVHMISYNGTAFIQFLVAEEIIHDAELLSTCVQEALSEMKAK